MYLFNVDNLARGGAQCRNVNLVPMFFSLFETAADAK